MKRGIVRSSNFVRVAKRLVKRRPEVAERVRQTVSRLAADAHDPRLQTHKLKGELADSWACSVTYDLRIIFCFIEDKGKPAILLQSLGTHDQVC